jgi:hypothetical protein
MSAISVAFVGWVEPSGLAFGKPKDRLRETHRPLSRDGGLRACGANPPYGAGARGTA